MCSFKLFLISGFFTLLPAILIRTMVENGTKTLSPTMLMATYEDISASTGNLLNIFIIVAGVVGTLLIKLVIYPRLIKNEIVAYQASPRGGTLYCTVEGERVKLAGKAALYSMAEIFVD